MQWDNECGGSGLIYLIRIISLISWSSILGGKRKKETKGAMISSDAELLFLTVLPSSSCHPSFPCQDVRRVRRVRLADGVIVTAIG